MDRSTKSAGVARPLVALLSLLLVVFAAAGTLGPASAQVSGTTTTDPARAAAGWLARQLVGDDHLESTIGTTTYPDPGLTADAVMAFDAAGVAGDASTRAAAWLAKPDVTSGYVGDGTVEAYAGAHAKLMLVAESRGLDPTAFGGVDLVARLASLLAPSGRYRDRSAYGDFTNGITQSLVVVGLSRRTGGAPASAVDFLAASQCPDGGFPEQFGAATCSASVDVTGFAVSALLAAGRATAAGKGLDYLLAIQALSGGFGDGGTVNANSTGLAVSALLAGGRSSDVAAAARGAAFLRSLQVGCSGAEAQRGAIAFDTTGFLAATAVRATPQAVLGLVPEGLATVSGQGSNALAPTADCAVATTTTGATTTTSASTTTTLAGVTTTGATTTTTTASGARSTPTTTVATRVLARTGPTSGIMVPAALALILAGAWALRSARRAW